MGLLTILKKMKHKEREIRLLMLGLDNAGKTTILKKFNGEDVSTISPTLGFNIKTLEHRGRKDPNIAPIDGYRTGECPMTSKATKPVPTTTISSGDGGNGEINSFVEDGHHFLHNIVDGAAD